MAHRPFRFGVHTSDAASGAEWAAAAQRYESLGFSTLLLRDHFDRQLAPIVAMTAAACATTTLRVGCLVYDNDYRHPLTLAKELATLDVLSGGRVEFGLGAGWMAPDYEQAGIPFDDPGVRVSRFEEAVQVVKALFADGPTNFTGSHYSITGHEMYPTPVQHGGPPLLVAGGGPRMLRIAARHADIIGLLPVKKSNAEWADQNVPDASAEATDAKIRTIREAAGERYDRIELQLTVPFVVVTDDRPGVAAAIAGSLPADPSVPPADVDAILSTPYVLLGSQDEICATLIERRERWDFSYYAFGSELVDTVAPIIARLAGK